jgi:hypothetical protein
MDTENKRKLYAGYIVLLGAILTLFSIRALHIARDFKIAEKFGYVKNISYSSELNFLLLNLLPLFVIAVELVWQYISFKKGNISSIDIMPLVTASIIGSVFYYLNDFSSSDGLGMAAGRVAIPIIQLLVYGVLRLCNLKEEEELKGK